MFFFVIGHGNLENALVYFLIFFLSLFEMQNEISSKGYPIYIRKVFRKLQITKKQKWLTFLNVLMQLILKSASRIL